MRVPRRLVKAALVGATQLGLERLLADVLDDVGLALEIVPRPEHAELAFAIVRADDVVSTICRLKQRGVGHVVALLAVRDPRVARRALDAGANVCFALDGPVQQLSFDVLALVASAAPPPRAAGSFRLGARAREIMQELRVFAARERNPTYRIRGDAEERLESAVRRDYGQRLPRPFRLGLRGRLETTAMHLDALAVERLERAIHADLDGELGRVA